MSQPELVLRNARLVYADGSIVDGGLVSAGGVIRDVFTGDPPEAAGGSEEIDAGGRYVLPGAIDPHVQLYPLPEWRHYATETRSAAVGGVTTIVKMHRDLEGYPADAFREEVAGAENRAYVDFCFHLCLMSEGQIENVETYARDFELTSFKLFMAYKGEEGFQIGIQGVDDGLLFEALTAIARIGGVALVHSESQELANQAKKRVRASGGDSLRSWAESRPPIVEAEAMRRVSYLARQAGCTLYVVHTTSRDGLEELVAARDAGSLVFIETCPHYLSETCDSDAGKFAKIIPPIREEDDREALWEGLVSGVVDSIGTDHVMRTRNEKDGTIWEAKLAFPGLATLVPYLLSEGVNSGRISLARLVEVTSTNPARIFGLESKGALAPGKDADFMVVDLDLEQTIDAAMLDSYSDFSIYEGRTFRGWPVLTVSRGEVVMRDGKVVGSEGHGRYVRRHIREKEGTT